MELTNEETDFVKRILTNYKRDLRHALQTIVADPGFYDASEEDVLYWMHLCDSILEKANDRRTD